MPTPGPGWYADPSHGNQMRWWDGNMWSDAPVQVVPVQKGQKRNAGKVALVVTLGLVVLVIAVASGTFPQFIVLGGVLTAAVGAFALVVGSARLLRVRSRKVGALLLGTGLIFAMVGGGASAATNAPDPAYLASVTAPDAVKKETTQKPTPTATPTPTPTPVVTEKEVREPVVIPFGSRTQNDPNMAVGTTAITTAGVDGRKTIIHLVTYVDGVETERSVLREEINVQPVAQVTSVGTKQPYVAPPPPPAAGDGCDSNYTGACVPVASDVDCEGGGGNGPGYVRGPVRIVGSDIYQLDRDGDGIACD